MPKIGEVKITAKWLPPMDGGEPLPYWWDERLEKPTVCPRNLVCAARQNKRKVVRQLMACLDRQIKEGDLRRVDFASLAALGVLAKNVYLAIERERVRRFWRSEMMRFEESTRRPGQRLKAGVKTK